MPAELNALAQFFRTAEEILGLSQLYWEACQEGRVDRELRQQIRQAENQLCGLFQPAVLDGMACEIWDARLRHPHR